MFAEVDRRSMSAMPLPTSSEPGAKRHQKRRGLAIVGVLALGGAVLAMSLISRAFSGDADENPDKRMSAQETGRP
ncbi:hypothetical protein [Streptomyces sp. NPDC001307]|uniref:hypothetical protein n=1 Tax=Streptomyces sp. NPDC001307 TaxID=3364560 RepID=UPI0036A7C788